MNDPRYIPQSIEIRGETLMPRWDRTLLWPAQNTVFVADVHLGKSASFRSMGVPLPTGSTGETLRRLSESVQNASRLVILGDLWHAKAGRSPENECAWHAWLEDHQEMETWLVQGNHDLKSGDLSHPRLRILPSGERLGPFSLIHEPDKAEGYALGGHLHPGVVLEGKGHDRFRLPCFWFRQAYAVLPAFGELTGCATIRPAGEDFIWAVAGNRVLRVQ